MYKFLVSTVFLLCTSFLYSQKGEETKMLVHKAKTELYINPEQSLKITEYLLHNYGSSNTIVVQCNTQLANYYFITGKYSLAVNNIMFAVKLLPQIDNKDIQIETLLRAAEIFSFLNLYEASGEYLNVAKKTAEGDLAWLGKIKNYEILFSKTEPATATYKQIVSEANHKDPSEFSLITKGTLATQVGVKYLEEGKMDTAAFYFSQKAAKNANGKSNNYWEMVAKIHYSDYDFKNKEYQNAIKALSSVLQKGNAFKSPFFHAIIYEKLAKNYLALKDRQQYREFSQKASASTNMVNTEKTLAVNAAFDKLQNEESENLVLLEKKETQTLWGLGIVVLVVVLIWLFVRWQYNTRINYTSNIVNYLKLINATEVKPETPEKLILKSNQRPKETDELLLSKLAKFETGSKYLNKDISLAQLASQLDTNTKYLSEVINQYKGKNFNVYINELRIHYIVNKLKTDPIYLSYKVSYLAEECGFSTHSSFSTVFKNITGITPNVFIQFLTQDKIEGSNVFSLN